MSKVHELTQASIEEGLFDADRDVRYTYDRADHYHKWHFRVRVALLSLLLIEGAVAIPLAFAIPENFVVYVVAVLGVAVVGLTIFDSTYDYGKLSVKLELLSDECQSLLTEWELLKLDADVGAIDDSEARDRHRRLLERTNVIFSRVEVTLDKDANERASDDSRRVLKEKHARTTSTA